VSKKRLPYHKMTPRQQANFRYRVKKEIEKRNKSVLFLPGEWRHWRERGYKPSEIDYDMCHIWR